MKAKKTEPRKNTTLVQNGGPVAAVAKVAMEIRNLIETARSHVSVTANLALVSLYWNTGRIITQDIQKNEKRAEYGTELMEQLAVVLTRDYGQGYSVHNLRDMKRFFDAFVIRQTASAESAMSEICPPLAGQSLSDQILQPLAGQSRLKQICQTPSNKLARRKIRQTVSAESRSHFLPTLSGISLAPPIFPTVSGESANLRRIPASCRALASRNRAHDAPLGPWRVARSGLRHTPLGRSRSVRTPRSGGRSASRSP